MRSCARRQRASQRLFRHTAEPLQSLFFVQRTHSWVVVLQIFQFGLPAQWLLLVHATQVLADNRQALLLLRQLQLLSERHSTQVEDVESQVRL